jgi:di/tricarboxylate transporter
VIIIALVLIVSRGLSRSGVVEIVARRVLDRPAGLKAHIGLMATLSAALSTLMNNVAALALLMPVDMQAARRFGRSPALTLMPLSFATILGGMVTLIGTPPNIVIATFRETALGEPYSMFDFAPVGLAVAAVGIAFVSLVGWRLIPLERSGKDTARELHGQGDFITEVAVKQSSELIGQPLATLEPEAEKHDVALLGLVRQGRRLPGFARREEVRKSDFIVLNGSPDSIDQFIGAAQLEYAGTREDQGSLLSPALGVIEVVVPAGARIDGRSANDVRLLYRQGVSLIGVSRSGRRSRERLRKLRIVAGDILLLLGPQEQLDDVVHWLGCLPLAGRGTDIVQRGKAWSAGIIFALAITLASLGLVYLPVALAAVVVAYVLLDIVPLTDLFESVEWPVIVLLGSMIPIGAAMDSVGNTALIASGIVAWTQGLSTVTVLVILMVVTMTLSDILNNVATALIAAPIAIDIAARLDANPDTFLMAVAVAASCAFLTPIGHKNNTIILGPGGYRFGDYWRMGLPLEGLVLLVGVPMILWVWPL